MGMGVMGTGGMGGMGTSSLKRSWRAITKMMGMGTAARAQTENARIPVTAQNATTFFNPFIFLIFISPRITDPIAKTFKKECKAKLTNIFFTLLLSINSSPFTI